MPHRTSRSRRYAGRAIVLSVLGWALFSRDHKELREDAAGQQPHDLDLGVEWNLPSLDVPEPAASPADTSRASRRPKRRLATSLAFATLFFAGAALSAGAGDMIASAVESSAAPSMETETGSDEAADDEATETDSVDENEPPVDDTPTETEPSSDGGSESEGEGEDGETAEGSEPPGSGEEGEAPGEDGDPGTTPEPGDGSGSEPGQDGEGSAPGGAETDGNTGGNGGQGDGNGDEPAGPPLIEPDPSSVTVPMPPDPEVAATGSAATIWLHRSLPDPTPAARRLAPGFARMLKTEAARARADWALVLGVLRAHGRIGRQPAVRSTLRRISASLVEHGARRNEWAAVLALYGRTSVADRAVAGARLNRAVGLRALVRGLEATKRALERTALADRRISLYDGGRSDIAAHRIDVRVLVTLRYLAEAFGQVTVSSLQSGHGIYSRPGVVSAHTYGQAVDIAALGGLSIVGNQEPGSITERAVRAILLLPPGLEARQVISLLGLGRASFAMANHHDHIHVGF